MIEEAELEGEVGWLAAKLVVPPTGSVDDLAKVDMKTRDSC